MDKENIKKIVREKYGSIVRGSGGCCGAEPEDNPKDCASTMSSCCPTRGREAADTKEKAGKQSASSSCCSADSGAFFQDFNADAISKAMGYSEGELASVPEGANLGLGCGNPIALASLKNGEVVLDLGSGAGFDAFLAAKQVGKSGKVIGVDMTPDMVEKARRLARKHGFDNVEFRLGEIEHLPLADASVDVIISNCVINLSPEKEKVFDEAFRVLKSDGRLMVSDIVIEGELPKHIRDSMEAYVGCVAGADLKDDYLGKIGRAGFRDVKIAEEKKYDLSEYLAEDKSTADGKKHKSAIASIRVSAIKP